MMSEYYAQATAVVVIDNMLLEISIEDPIEEQLFVLYISNWVQRMWTLPEVLLSKQLFFRLKDGLVDFRTYFSDEVLSVQLHNPVAWKLLGWFVQLMITPFERACGQSQSFSLDNVALHLAKRSSSKPEDEILAIAGLFDLDVREYLSLGVEERMMVFLAKYNKGKVPADILFLDGPKLEIENFLWAPRSFMNRTAHIELKGSGENDWSFVTSQGLVGGGYHCLQMQKKWAGEIPHTYRIATPGNNIFTIVFQRSIDAQEKSIPQYDTLIFSRNVEPGEEFLAAACESFGEIEVADQGETLLHLGLQCYVHVFNEIGNLDWNKLPVANEAYHRPGLVLIT